MNQLPTRAQSQTEHPLSHGGFRPRASTRAALAFRPQAHHMPPPGLGHLSLLDHLSQLGPSMAGPRPHLSGAAPRNLSRHPPHSHSRAHAEQLLLQRRLESGPRGEDPHPRNVVWRCSPPSPLEFASCRMLAGHCLLLPADWVRGSKTAVRRRRVGRGGGRHARGVAWGEDDGGGRK